MNLKKKEFFYRGYLSSGLPHPDPHHGDEADAKTNDEREQHEHVTVIITCIESEQLENPTRRIANSARGEEGKARKARTRFMMREAETLTGTPCRTSLIWSPELTSFTANASRAYLSGHIHCSHRSTCGIALRWTKNPAKVIWYNPDRALRSSARPPSAMAEPRRKFCIVSFGLTKEERPHE